MGINALVVPFLLLPCVMPHSYTNTPYREASGLFYNNLGEAKISNSKLTLVSYVNFTHLSRAFERANHYFFQSQNLCALAMKESLKHSYTSFHCEQTLRVIKDQLSSISTKDETIYHISGQKLQSRNRRGLINGGSYILNWLFGTPDADDAQYYTDSINNLLNNNKQTQTLLKTQIQVISSTIQNFNNSVVSLQLNENKLNKNIEMINKLSSETNQYLDDLKLHTIITQHVMTLSLFTSRLSSEYDQYINSINLGKHGILSPQILTPKILFEELTKYKGHHELPIQVDYSNIHLYYKILELQVIPAKDITIFAIKIPLVNKDTFNIYELIPLPMQHNTSSIFSYIEPKQPFLLLSQSKIYSTLVKDLSNCNEYLEQHFICRGVHINKRTDQLTCETQLLFTPLNRMPEDCRTETFKAEVETWKYIKYNQWIYVLQKPITVTIICENQLNHMEDVTLHQTGILQLKPSCKGYTDLFVLETTSSTSRNISHYVPRLDITTDDCCLLTRKFNRTTPIQLTPIKITNIDLSELKYANKKLSEFDQIITDQLNKPFIIRHTKWYTIVLSTIGTILFLTICLNCCRRFGWLQPLKRLSCFIISPRNGDIIPPEIKSTINPRSSHSDTRPEHSDHTQEIVIYDRNRDAAVARVTYTVPEEEEEEEEDVRPTTSRGRIPTRRSNIPM